jgi:hypothetical protein
MTDQTESQDEVEINSYAVTVTRVFEVDFSNQQVGQLMQQTGQDEAEAAIEAALEADETNKIAPEQKLLGIDVMVDGD